MIKVIVFLSFECMMLLKSWIVKNYNEYDVLYGGHVQGKDVYSNLMCVTSYVSQDTLKKCSWIISPLVKHSIGLRL